MRWSGQLVGVKQSNQGKSRKSKKEIKGPEKGRNEEGKGRKKEVLSVSFTHRRTDTHIAERVNELCYRRRLPSETPAALWVRH